MYDNHKHNCNAFSLYHNVQLYKTQNNEINVYVLPSAFNSHCHFKQLINSNYGESENIHGTFKLGTPDMFSQINKLLEQV